MHELQWYEILLFPVLNALRNGIINEYLQFQNMVAEVCWIPNFVSSPQWLQTLRRANSSELLTRLKFLVLKSAKDLPLSVLGIHVSSTFTCQTLLLAKFKWKQNLLASGWKRKWPKRKWPLIFWTKKMENFYFIFLHLLQNIAHEFKYLTSFPIWHLIYIRRRKKGQIKISSAIKYM